MGRPSAYSEAEDAIILATAGQPLEETNARLKEAGFEERTNSAIKMRRHYLRKRSNNPVDDRETELTRALLRRKHLTEELERLKAQHLSVLEEIKRLTQEIHGLLDEVREELDAEDEVVEAHG